LTQVLQEEAGGQFCSPRIQTSLTAKPEKARHHVAVSAAAYHKKLPILLTAALEFLILVLPPRSAAAPKQFHWLYPEFRSMSMAHHLPGCAEIDFAARNPSRAHSHADVRPPSYPPPPSSSGSDNLLGDGTIYPAQEANTTHTVALADTPPCPSSEYSYFSCDHSADYITTGSNGENNLLGDGTIYPAQEANTTHTAVLADTPPCPSSEYSYFSCDHSADYITTGSNGETNLTGDGTIYPAYAPFAKAHTVGLSGVSGCTSDHGGAYYCADGHCSTSVTEPTPVSAPAVEFNANHGHMPALYEEADHSGAYYCTEPEVTHQIPTYALDPKP
jgi:hypothetical protein